MANVGDDGLTRLERRERLRQTVQTVPEKSELAQLPEHEQNARTFLAGATDELYAALTSMRALPYPKYRDEIQGVIETLERMRRSRSWE